MEELDEKRKHLLKKAKKFIDGGWFFCNNCRNITKTLIQRLAREVIVTTEAAEDDILEDIEIKESRPRHLETICPKCRAEMPYTPKMYKVFYRKDFEKFLPYTPAIRRESPAERRRELRRALAEAVVEEMIKQYKAMQEDIISLKNSSTNSPSSSIQLVGGEQEDLPPAF